MPGKSQTQLQARARSLRKEDGNVLILTAFGLTFLVGSLALAVDTGRLLFSQRQLQTLADAAALAGAAELTSCGSTSNCTAMQTAAKSALTENGVNAMTLVTQCGSSSNGGMILILNNGPCYMGAKDPNQNSTSYVEAVVKMPVTTFFATVLGKGPFTVEARSEAAGAKPTYCTYILNPTASDAFLINGNATLTASCGIIVDSSASPAAIFNGGDNITSTVLDIVGTDINNGNNSISPAPVTGSKSASDPLSGLATPTIGSCGSSTSSPYSGANNQVIVNGGVSAVFNPGVYCGGIIINGSASATFNAGTYIIENGMIVNGGDTVSGSGVTFYFQSGALTMNGSSHAVFSAPTTGTYAGILYFQNRTDSTSIILNGDSTSGWQGAIYAADAGLTINGGNTSAVYTDLVVNTLTENGNDNFTIGSNYSSLPGGPPIASNSRAYLVE